MPKRNFNVIVVHGHGEEWRKVRSYIRQAGYTPRVLAQEYKAGVIFNRWRDTVWDDVHCAVVLMTGDDRAGGELRARQNVVFELGYCYGAFDSLDDEGEYTAENAIIVLREEGVEGFSDIAGLTTIDFKKGRLGKKRRQIVEVLDSAYRRALTFYDLSRR